MMKRQYSRAERIDKRLRWARAAAAQAETKELLQGQREERRSLSEAHQRQMAYLHREWKQYFLQLHQRETLIFRSFQKEQIHTHMAAETALRRRCASLHTTAPDIRYLQQQEQLLRKSQDFHHLKAVKQQLAEAVSLILVRNKGKGTGEAKQWPNSWSWSRTDCESPTARNTKCW